MDTVSLRLDYLKPFIPVTFLTQRYYQYSSTSRSDPNLSSFILSSISQFPPKPNPRPDSPKSPSLSLKMATEEPTVAVDSAPEAAEDKPAENKSGGKSGKTKKSKESKAKKAAAPKKPRAPPSHPPYEEMIKDAVVTLKEKTGSSQYAITKFIEEKQKHLPGTFKKLLLFHLKKLVAAGKLVKVKNSFKLPSARSSKLSTAASAPAKKKPAATKSKPKPASKAKEGKSTKAASKAPAKTKAATKTKTKAAAIPKAPRKSKSSTTKTKAVSTLKPKATAAAKSKAVAKPKPKPKPKEKPVKAARTSTRTSPGKKAAATKPAPKKAPARAPAKSVKPKTVKSPAKKGTSKRGKK
ncbi:hypothetical protein QUC31_004579 [Theobroma cacao]